MYSDWWDVHTLLWLTGASSLRGHSHSMFSICHSRQWWLWYSQWAHSKNFLWMLHTPVFHPHTHTHRKPGPGLKRSFNQWPVQHLAGNWWIPPAFWKTNTNGEHVHKCALHLCGCSFFCLFVFCITTFQELLYSGTVVVIISIFNRF